MKHVTPRMSVAVVCLAFAGLAGCDEKTAPSSAERSADPTGDSAGSADAARNGADPDAAAAGHESSNAATGEAREALPPGHPPLPGRNTGAPLKGRTLELTGVTMTVPEGWDALPVQGQGSMAPKAVFQIPNPDGSPGSVRLTYFPGMKGMDDANIQRWVAQARRPDGTPATREDATIERVELDGVQLTTVDISGKIQPTMRDAPKENQRMIAAIVDHARGPHFVVIVGPAELMAKAEPDVQTFLRSASVSGP